MYLAWIMLCIWPNLRVKVSPPQVNKWLLGEDFWRWTIWQILRGGIGLTWTPSSLIIFFILKISRTLFQKYNITELDVPYTYINVLFKKRNVKVNTLPIFQLGKTYNDFKTQNQEQNKARSKENIGCWVQQDVKKPHRFLTALPPSSRSKFKRLKKIFGFGCRITL